VIGTRNAQARPRHAVELCTRQDRIALGGHPNRDRRS
jgi:hypothetical protein